MNKVFLGFSLIFASVTFGLAQSSSSAGNVAVTSGTTIDAQLQKKLDVNDARVGDEVVLKVAKSIKQNGEVAIPKGTTLLGRVTEVQRRTKDNASSKLGIIFDRIQRNGMSAPFSASIVSIVSASTQVAAGETFMTETSGSAQASGGVSRGGLLGGVGNTVGGVVNTATQTAGVVTNTVTQTTGTVTRSVGGSLGGVQISNSVGGSASSVATLSASNKNLRVEKGATFNLRVNGQVARQE